jgi:P4 family phage/plasmid primase-like protien
MSTPQHMKTNNRFKSAEAVCRAVHGDDPFAVKYLYRCKTTRRVKQTAFEHLSLEEHLEQFSNRADDGWEAFLLLGRTDGDGYKAENVISTQAIAIDWDQGFDREDWIASRYRPSIILHTSEGRAHTVWLLDSSIPAAQFSQYARCFAWRFGGDASFGTAIQAVRLPGFVNRKNSKNKWKVVLDDASRLECRFDHQELAAAFDFRLVKAARFEPEVANVAARSHSHALQSGERLLEDLKDALNHLSPEPYDDWIDVGMVLKRFGAPGKDLWTEWARKSSKFREGEAEYKWDTFDKHGKLNAATIFYKAQKKGWKNPGQGRHGGVTVAREVSLMDLGRMLSEQMGRDYAVIEVEGAAKGVYRFKRWNGEAFQGLNDQERRQCIADEFALLVQRRGQLEDFRAVTRDTGTKRGLDGIAEHIGEYLLAQSRQRDASGYPYFAVANGVVNLLTGKLVPADLRPVTAQRGTVAFVPGATCPKFTQFVRQITAGDREFCRYLMRLFGYIALGDPKQHVFPIFIGKGGNGKSVLVNVMSHLFGDYVGAVPPTVIMAKSHVNDAPTPFLAKLKGTRLAVIAEPNGKHQLDAGVIKNLTGGENIAVRGMYRDVEAFRPEFVPIVLTNEMPGVRDNDHGMWRRLQIVPFSQTFEGKERDTNLERKLIEEASGILNRLLTGVGDYLTQNLNPPSAVTAKTARLRAAVNPFEQFFKNYFEVDEAAEFALAEAYAAFERWRKANPSHRAMSKQEIGKNLERRGLVRNTKRNVPYFQGARLVPGSLGPLHADRP